MSRRANGTGSKPKWNPNTNRFEGKVSLPNGTRRSITAATEREYEQKRDKLLTAIAGGLPTPTQQLTLSAYLDDWLESVRISTLPSTRGLRSNRKRKTYVSYEGLVRVHIKPALGKYPLVRLSPAIVQRQLIDAKLETGASVRRVKMMRDVLRIALNRARKLGLATQNPALDVDIDGPNSSRIDRALRPEQTVALLEAMRPYRYGTLITFLVTTGLRFGEALALRWTDVDLKRRSLYVDKTLDWKPGGLWSREDPKAHSANRHVPLVAPAMQALLAEQDRQAFVRARARDAWNDNGLVFSNDIGDPIREESARDGFRRGLRLAGLNPKEHRVHDLRHTAASYLAMLGVPTRTIMAIMGHSTLAMTQNYSHVFDSMLDDARATLDRFYSTQLGT